MLEAIHAAPTPTSRLVFDAESVTYVDSTGLETFADLIEELRRQDVELVVARLRTRMHDQFQLAGLTDKIGRERLYPSVREAVDAWRSQA